MHAELVALATKVMGSITQPSEWPTAAPVEGQSVEQWRSRVASLREQHDALALDATHLCPPLTAPPSDTPLDVSFVSIEVEPGHQQSGKLYRPTSERHDRPAVLVLHGGGWWMAGGAIAFDIGDPMCRVLAAELDAVVLNFDYRLAPEFPYPTALHDADAAVQWLVRSAESLGIDTDAVCVFGISSGGNLAAALARRLRRTERALKLQMLQVPALDLTFSLPSCAAQPEWQAQGAMLRSYYVPEGVDPLDPFVSPGRTDDYADLPPAVVVVGAFDPLRDDGLTYVESLQAAGIPAVVLDYQMTHGIATRDVTDRWLLDVTEHAARFLAH